MLDRIKEFFKRKEEFIEFEPEEKEEEKVTIRMEKLGGIVDADRIARLLLEGNIVFLNVRDLQKRDFGQFQTSVEKLKRYSNQYGWDIAATDDGYLLLTPRFARISRE